MMNKLTPTSHFASSHAIGSCSSAVRQFCDGLPYIRSQIVISADRPVRIVAVAT